MITKVDFYLALFTLVMGTGVVVHSYMYAEPMHQLGVSALWVFQFSLTTHFYLKMPKETK